MRIDHDIDTGAGARPAGLSRGVIGMGNGWIASASAVAMLVAPLAASAQASADATQLEEIIVTATRRSERLQDVPLSITAFSQEELTTKGIVGYEGLARETPGVVLNKPTANFNNFTARGIATNGYGANLQNTVAIYIDELPISSIGNTTVIDPNLFDVERIEFLRGPQGTLFGSGSLSGAVRILTKSPDLNVFDAEALVDTGVTDGGSLRQRYNGMINVPLIDDKLALRAVGFYRDEEGYVDNLGTGIENSNTLIDWGGRVILLAQPTDALSVRLLASYEHSKPEDSSLIDPTLGKRKRNSDRPDLFVGELTTFNATIEYQFDGARLTSSSTYSTFDQKFFVDLAGTFGGAIAFGLDALGYQDTFVEELRAASDPGGRFDWVIGGFFLDRRHDVNYFYRSSAEFLAARGLTGLPDEYYQRQYVHINSHEIAGFGELTYRLTDRFWLTGGMRYGSLDSQLIVEGGYNSDYLALALTPGYSGPVTIFEIPPAVGVKAKGRKPSYKFSASFQPVPAITTYATVSTGFRAPVVNAFAGLPSLIDPNDLVIPDGADTDKIRNYELGAKGSWLDGRLTFNATAFHYDYKDVQVNVVGPNPGAVGGATVSYLQNAAKAKVDGAEFELTFAPVEGLQFNAALGLLDTEYKTFQVLNGGANLAGAQFVRSPKVTLNAGASYSFAVGDLGRIELAADARYTSRQYYYVTPQDKVNRYYLTQKPYTLTNVRVTYTTRDERISVTGFVNNLFDVRYLNHALPGANPALGVTGDTVAWADPLTAGGAVIFRF